MAVKWIQKAIKKKGALRATAKKAGALKDGILAAFLEKQAKKKGKAGMRARLAQRLKTFAKGKKKKV